MKTKMKSLISSLLLAALVMSCDGGDGTSPATNPAAGTVLSTECEEYTLVSEIADGSGGSNLEREDESTECGWEEPVLQISVEKGRGDRFKPVVFEVSYSQFGEPLQWDYEQPAAGNVKRTENGLEIYSDGDLGEHVVVIAGEEFQYSLISEPVCEVQRQEDSYGAGLDCEGLWQSGSTDDYIYYGPETEDTQIVTWDIIYMQYAPEFGPWEKDKAPHELTEGNWDYDRSLSEVEHMNELLERSGVYVRLNLVTVYAVDNFGYDYRRWIDAGLLKRSDIILDWIRPGGSVCGYAGMQGKFRSYAEKGWLYYLRPTAGCGSVTSLHEIGHTVGLGHGIFNSSQAGCGITWPEFACGQSSFCGIGSDIMFYGGSQKLFSTPNRTCKDAYPSRDHNFDDDEVTGRLDFSATAYAINRVRYDVSLIHDEHNKVEHALFEQLQVPKRKFTANDFDYDFPEIHGDIIYD